MHILAELCLGGAIPTIKLTCMQEDTRRVVFGRWVTLHTLENFTLGVLNYLEELLGPYLKGRPLPAEVLHTVHLLMETARYYKAHEHRQA